jgi:hypothetical protein
MDVKIKQENIKSLNEESRKQWKLRTEAISTPLQQSNVI